MNWTGSHSRVDKGVTIGVAGSTVCFLRTIWFCLHPLSMVFNMHLIGCQLRATMQECKVALKRRRYYVSPQTQASAGCKYAAIHCSSREVQVPWGGIHEWRNREVDTRFGKANAVLLELDRYLVTERELSNIAMLSDFKSVIAPILTYGHEFWVMTERVLSKVQAA